MVVFTSDKRDHYGDIMKLDKEEVANITKILKSIFEKSNEYKKVTKYNSLVIAVKDIEMVMALRLTYNGNLSNVGLYTDSLTEIVEEKAA